MCTHMRAHIQGLHTYIGIQTCVWINFDMRMYANIYIYILTDIKICIINMYLNLDLDIYKHLCSSIDTCKYKLIST